MYFHVVLEFPPCEGKLCIMWGGVSICIVYLPSTRDVILFILERPLDIVNDKAVSLTTA